MQVLPKISIVTISFNQARFIESAIRSVIEQDYPHVEYIVVDPGSTDGSREIIERYRDQIDTIIFEQDEGPADGLNKGFARATGDIYGFLNSDDFLLPEALQTVANAFGGAPHYDVLSGHSLVVDECGAVIRRFYSCRFTALKAVYGAATLPQQSTFFKAAAYHKVEGFNTENRVAWDGELWIDMALGGAKFGRINAFLSAFRLHAGSISGSGRLREEYALTLQKLFRKVRGRGINSTDELIRPLMKALEYTQHPRFLAERLLHGPIIPCQERRSTGFM